MLVFRPQKHVFQSTSGCPSPLCCFDKLRVSCTHRNQPAIGYKVPLFPHQQCLHRSDVPYRYWSCTSIVVTGFQYSHTSSGYRYLMFPYQQCNSYRVPIPVVATRFQFSHTDCGHRVPFQQWLQDTNLFSQIVATACSIIKFVFTMCCSTHILYYFPLGHRT